jgi:hypothetical protein
MGDRSLESLLAEIEAAGQIGQPDGFSLREFAAALRVHERSARPRLWRLIEQGRAEYAGKASRPTMSGGVCLVPVYRQVKGKRK